MSAIYRWCLPDDGQDSVMVEVPSDCLRAEAVEFTEEGVSLLKLHLERPEPNAPIEFPLVHVWDDPSRSEHLKREGEDWKDEDTGDMLRLWEQTRLEQFYKHLLRDFRSMQVIYLQAPVAEPTFSGWRVQMVAAIFGGFIPPSLEAWSFGTKSKIITLEKPKLVQPKGLII